MKKEIIVITHISIIFIIVSLFFVAGLISGRNSGLVAPKTEGGPHCITKECKDDYNFTLQNNGYSGWQMGCNYTGESDAGWDENTYRFGQQNHLDCANGLVYEVIGRSLFKE